MFGPTDPLDAIDREGWTRWLERKIIARKRAEVRHERGTAATMPFLTTQRTNPSVTHAALPEPRYVDFSGAIGWRALTDAVETFGAQAKAQLTALVPPLDADLDPDDAFSAVPYEKK